MASRLSLRPAMTGLNSVPDVDVDDITDWINDGEISTFRDRIVALRKSERLRLTDVSEYALHIMKKFSKAGSKAANRLDWLLILFTQDMKLNREFLDILILQSKNQTSDHTPTRLKALHAEELFKLLVGEHPKLLTLCHTTTNRSLFHEAAVRGSYEILVHCYGEILRHNPENGRAIASRLILAQDREGQTALSLAVETGNEQTITALLPWSDIGDEDVRIPALLLASINKMRSLTVIKAILCRRQHRKAGEETAAPAKTQIVVDGKQYQEHLITNETLGTAIANNRKDIVDFFISVCPGVLRDESCTLLHDAVEKDLAEIAQMLIETQPELAVRMKMYSISVPGEHLTIETVEQSALTLVRKDTKNGQLIKAKIMPVLMQLLTISEIRRHLKGGEWNEIYLDLTYLKTKPRYLNDFLASVSYDLDQARQVLEANALQTRAVSTASKFNYDVDFESALKYVEIPMLERKESGSRQEAAIILEWLRTCKKVTNIYELRVEDSLQDPHSEEEVERALQDFDIRELDWKRTDLSILAIKDQAPDLERLTLYSSGNLAALDHWLGPNGVCTLEELRHLSIVIVTDNLTSRRVAYCKSLVRENLLHRDGYRECRKSQEQKHTSDLVFWNVLTESWETARAFLPADAAQSQEATSSKSYPVSVAGLGNFLQSYQSFVDEYNHFPKRGITANQNSKVRTKVAILDTGINRGLSPGQFRCGASFFHRDPGRRERESPWWLAADPHGSYVANIVSQLDPCCDIYIAQIAMYKNHIPLRSVVKAFEWAIGHGVQIINCSFVLFEKHPELEAQINVAADKGVLIMCSTADEGYIRQDVWPAKYRSSNFVNVFPIAACDSKGKLTGYSSETLAQYRLQGEQINASHQFASLRNNVTEGIVSGSSVATAMATGIASLVLACESMVRIFENTKVSRNAVQVVTNTFSKMCATNGRESGPIFITPNTVFPQKKDYFRDNDHFKDWIVAFGKRLGS